MRKILFFAILSALLPLAASCSGPEQAAEAPPVSLDSIIDDFARTVESPAVPVRGFGIVAGLFGTGSAECPPQLRQELEKHIWQQIPDAKTISPRRFIESRDTAVVEVLGVIPPMAAAGESFDVVIRPLSSTQTTSLSGGFLYATDLKELSRFTQFNQYARTIARSQGPIFTHKHHPDDDVPEWYVLGGGYTLSGVTISLLLNQPDYLVASTIRNRLNERFGARTANAVSANEVLLTIPQQYRHDRERFVRMVRQTYLAEQPALRQQRIDTLISRLKTEQDKLLPELGLEAIGSAALDELAVLLKSDDEVTRFHAARCMSNIGDRRAIPVLRELVFDRQSPHRGPALRTIGRNMRTSDAEAIFLRALADEDIAFRLVAYETALAARSVNIRRTLVANDFFVDRVRCGGSKAIYARRSGQAGIVIFGSPIRCDENLFFRYNDGEVTINALTDDRFISVSRSHPARPRVVGPISSGYEVSQLIRALGESPEQKKGQTNLPGLSLSYTQIIEILEQMCALEKIPARFHPGPLTEAGAVFKEF